MAPPIGKPVYQIRLARAPSSTTSRIIGANNVVEDCSEAILPTFDTHHANVK